MDFVADQLSDGKRIRSLTVVDIFTRESLAIEVGQSLKGEDVVHVLNQLKQERGAPKVLFCDNGPEFTGQMMDTWAYKNEVKIDFSRPGKPTDNAFCESFNGTFRSECLDTNWFNNLEDARRIIEAWRREYMRVVLTGLSPTGHQWNSPARSRLAAIWLKPKQADS